MASDRPSPPPTGRGYDAFEVVSALQKALRRSQVKEAVYWATEMYESGHQAWLWNRLQEILSEDIGPADRYLPATIQALRETSDDKRRKKGSGGMEAAHAVILMATAKKSRLAALMVIVASSDHHERLEIPDEALDRHTIKGKRMGRGLDHFLTEAAKTIDLEDPGLTLEELETEYLAKRREIATATGPDNPWRRGETGQNPMVVTSDPLRGQLRLDPKEPLG